MPGHRRISLQTLQPRQWESGALTRTGRRLRRNATKKKNKHFPCIVTGTADRRRRLRRGKRPLFAPPAALQKGVVSKPSPHLGLESCSATSGFLYKPCSPDSGKAVR